MIKEKKCLKNDWKHKRTSQFCIDCCCIDCWITRENFLLTAQAKEIFEEMKNIIFLQELWFTIYSAHHKGKHRGRRCTRCLIVWGNEALSAFEALEWQALKKKFIME